jgi:hypothetical protein
MTKTDKVIKAAKEKGVQAANKLADELNLGFYLWADGSFFEVFAKNANGTWKNNRLIGMSTKFLSA